MPQAKQAVNTLTDAATINVDWNVSDNHQVTLGGNRTLTFSNPLSGGVYRIKLVQDATGSRTLTWPGSVVWKGGAAPTLTATATYVDVIEFFYDGAAYRDVTINKNYAS